MQTPLEIVFHQVDRSPAVEDAVRERVARLERFAHDITSCRVTVETPHRHHQQGNLYAVRVELRYPGSELVVNRSPAAKHAHEDVYVALGDAFRAARRQLQDRQRVRRGDVKPHHAPPHAVIASLDRTRDYGRLRTSDGREVYFHRNSVINADFDRLSPDMEVRFHEEAGEQGPQASSVHLISRPHVAR
jgi:ribosomal subunit interface protein